MTVYRIRKWKDRWQLRKWDGIAFRVVAEYCTYAEALAATSPTRPINRNTSNVLPMIVYS